MDTPPPTEGFPSDLTEHGRFVRALARQLLHDEDAADDVAQETLLAAVESRPSEDRPLRPWLATVARNVVRKRFRSAGRRRRREEAAARPEGLPSTADMVARAEMLRRVVDAVLALEEPNRSTILLRFYEDLPPRDIAARQGVGVETVRGRLKRGVEQVRRHLDARHPGGRAAWAPVLAGLCGVDLPAHLAAGAGGASAGTGAPEALTSAVPTAAPAPLAVAAALVLGLGTGALLAREASTPRPVEHPGVVATAPSLVPSGTEGEDPETDLAPREQVSLRIARAEARRAGLEEEVRRLRAEVERLRPPPGDPAAYRSGVPPTAMRFLAAPWRDLAGHVLAMQAAMPEVRATVRRGEELDGARVAALAAENQPVAGFALAIAPELGAPDANTAYLHPAVTANLVRAGLDLVGQPLSPDQAIAVGALAEAAVAEEEEALRRLPEDRPVLARRLVVAETRLRFLAAVKGVLSPEQRARLFPPETEGRAQLDLLSPGLLFPLRHDVVAGDRGALGLELVRTLFALAGLADVDAAPYDWVGRQWVESVAETLPASGADVDRYAFVRIEDLLIRLRAQVAATERILAMGGLAPEAALALARVEMPLAPAVR